MIENDDFEAFTIKRFLEYMEIFHVSINKLYQITGVARSTIKRYLSGKATLSLYVLGKFLKYIKVEVDVFYEPYVISQRRLAGLA